MSRQMSRTGLLVGLTGLVTTVFCAVAALLLINFVGWENWLFNVEDMVIKLTVMGSLGLFTMAVGMALSRPGAKQLLAFGSLGLIAVAVVLVMLLALRLVFYAGMTIPDDPQMRPAPINDQRPVPG